MKTLAGLLVLLFFTNLKASCQDFKKIDSLQNELTKFENHKRNSELKTFSLADSTACNTLYELVNTFLYNNYDSAEFFAKKQLQLSRQIEFHKGSGKALNALGVIECYKGNYKEALVYHAEALKIRQTINDMKGIAASYQNTGIVYSEQGNYAEALKYYLIALPIREKINDKKGLGDSYSSIGLIYYNQGNYTEAMKGYFKALKIAEEFGDKSKIMVCYDYIGIIYDELNNTEEALKNFKASLIIANEIGDKMNAAQAYADMGIVYKKIKNEKEALTNYEAALKLWEELKDPRGIAVTSGNIGILYYSNKNYPEALHYLFKALGLFEKTGQEEGVEHVCHNIAIIYKDQNKLKEALEYENKSLALAKKLGDQKALMESYENLAVINEKSRNYEIAYENFILFKDASDSLFNSDNKSTITKIQMQYDFDKKQFADSLQNIQKTQLSEAKIKQQRMLLYISITAALVIIFLIVYWQRTKIARERSIQQHEFARQLLEIELKALRAQMNPHFIFNCLNSIQAYILRENKNEATDFLQKFSLLIRMILDNSQKTSNSIEDEMEIINLYLQLEQMRLKNKFDFKIEVDESINKAETEVPSMVIQPLVENSIWHGLMHLEQKGMLKIKILNEGGNLKCLVEDNGIGREKSMELKSVKVPMHESKGMKLIQDRLKAWSETKGFQYTFNINDLNGALTGTQTEIVILDAIHV